MNDAEIAWSEYLFQRISYEHNIEPRTAFLAGFAASESRNRSALDLMRSLSINPIIPDGIRVLMKKSLPDE